METTPRRPSPRRSLPMPLWLQAVIEIFLASLGSWAVIALLLAIGWASLGFPGSILTVLGGAGHLWLAGHGVPLHLSIPQMDTADAVRGVASFTPLGLTAVLLLFARRAGRRLARASYEGQFWQALVGGAVAYVLIATAISLAANTQELSTHTGVAALVPLWVLVVGMFWGGHGVAGSWLRLIGVDPDRLAEKYSQYSRWAGAYLVSLIRAAWVGILGVLAGGALLTGLSIFVHWNRLIALYQSLHAGFLGDISVTLLQLAILPNLIIFGMAWGVGSGFAVGDGTLVSPAATHAGALPSLPVLGAIPAHPSSFAYVALALPILAGALAGWYFIRDGENHLDEWFSLKLSWRWLAALLSGLVLALSLGLIVGLVACLVSALAQGSLGVGRFGEFGPNPWLTGLWTAVTVAIGAIIGQLIGPWIESDPNAPEVTRRPKPAGSAASAGKRAGPSKKSAASSSASEEKKSSAGTKASPGKKSSAGKKASAPAASPKAGATRPKEGATGSKGSATRADRAKPAGDRKTRDDASVSALTRLRRAQKSEDAGTEAPWAGSAAGSSASPTKEQASGEQKSEERMTEGQRPEEQTAESQTAESKPPESQAPEGDTTQASSEPDVPHAVPQKRPVIGRPGRRPRRDS